MKQILKYGLVFVAGFSLATGLLWNASALLSTDFETVVDANKVEVASVAKRSGQDSSRALEKIEDSKVALLDLAVHALIDAMDESRLIGLLSSFTGLSAPALESRLDIKSYAGRLASIALGSDVTIDIDAATMSPIEFSIYNDMASLATRSTTHFDSRVPKIFAWFDPTIFDGGHVLVRWSYLDTGQILLYNRLPVSTDDTLHHVWLRRESWEPGRYQVDVYADNEFLSKIATGSYQIHSS